MKFSGGRRDPRFSQNCDEPSHPVRDNSIIQHLRAIERQVPVSVLKKMPGCQFSARIVIDPHICDAADRTVTVP